MMLSKVRKAIRNPTKAREHLMKKPFIFIDKYLNYGTNIFEREWDLLIVLDACRYDLFAEFCPQHSVHDLLDSTEAMYSIASQTPDWLRRTFNRVDDHQLSQTVFIAGNGFIKKYEPDELQVEHAWRIDTHPEGQVPPPEIVTNEAIRNFRTTNVERYIVHYLQPHAPFLHCMGKYNSAVGDYEGKTMNVWKGLRDGKFEKSEIWEDYGENLLLVLDNVEKLIKNFDGRVAITSDHGNAMGEYGLYGHPGREAAPSIRRVPWAVATGLGLDNYELKDKEELRTKDEDEDTDLELEQHLKNLGYKT